MYKIWRKTTSIMANNRVSDPENIDSIDDLSSWEFVSPSQSDDEEIYSFNDDAYSAAESEQEAAALEPHPPSHDDVISMESLSVSPTPLTLDVGFTHQVYHDDSEYDDEIEGSGLDDELVPLKLKDRFGKQRITKIGRRGGSRVNKSKKVSYYYNRPGCVYGKHGLGVQHCFI
ncbi:unnamed protein product [Fraxinus pennsylvanica]|uniref:Uncharacterized protein n=1 Tax=Fraxinus pennsylvanica TaxID=56036 RepID=A0AAD1ZFX0_9LAMI|nr:unnamed protein product [Fraxinus pennsylvanica]